MSKIEEVDENFNVSNVIFEGEIIKEKLEC